LNFTHSGEDYSKNFSIIQYKKNGSQSRIGLQNRSISSLRLFALETIEIRRECGCANRALLQTAF